MWVCAFGSVGVQDPQTHILTHPHTSPRRRRRPDPPAEDDTDPDPGVVFSRPTNPHTHTHARPWRIEDVKTAEDPLRSNPVDAVRSGFQLNNGCLGGLRGQA